MFRFNLYEFRNLYNCFVICILINNHLILLILRIINLKQNERISTFQKLLKSFYYRNNYEITKIESLLNICSRNISLLKISS